MTEAEKVKCRGILKLFKIHGVPADKCITDGQLEIFFCIITGKYKRVQFITPTQYGKSLVVALACLVKTCIMKEQVAVVAPTSEKAKIIMRYYIEHLSDSPIFSSQLEKNTKLDRLQMEESKERIILRNGGGIFVISAQAGNSQKGIEAAMGMGCKNVITDESSLTPDDIESTIFRMIAGYKDGFYCKIGNPFYRNHFYESWQDPRYHKVFIDWRQAVAEGRYNQDFVDEARGKPNYSILYECIFPDDELMDDKGYYRLFPDELIKRSQSPVKPFGEQRLGVDCAEGGGDSNCITIRYANFAKVLEKFKSEDTMALPGHVIQQLSTTGTFDHNVFMDSIGVGKGAFDRLREQRYNINEVKFSEKAEDESQFSNKRSECYWRFYQWLQEGGKLEPSSEWNVLRKIKYTRDSQGRIKLMPKIDIKKEIGYSPDAADSIAMTFGRAAIINSSSKERKEQRELIKQFDFNRKNQGKRMLTGSAYLRNKGCTL